MNEKQSCQPSITCLVCGDVARGFNFDVMTCMSCKTFFRRHALESKKKKFTCHNDNKCKITKDTRSLCGACRLKKCFSLGMNPKLIRSSAGHDLISKQNRVSIFTNKNQSSYPHSVLLKPPQNNYILLRNDEWTLLSNITHAYDAANIIPHIKNLFEQRSPLPPKIRSKLSNAIPLLKAFYVKLQSFAELIPLFRNLPILTRLAMLENNSEIAGVLSAIFVARELNALNNMAFLANLNSVYGHEFVIYAHQFVSRLEPNEILTKIMVVILLFSTNCSFVDAYCSKDRMNSTIALSVISIQNVLVTMFWKYLVYHYGFNGAVQRYSSLIKYILDIIHLTHALRTAEHDKMMEIFVEETKRSLIIED